MRGTVLRYDDRDGTGYISGDDGTRYTFTRADLQQLQPISVGTKLDFDTDGKQAKEIFVLPSDEAPEAPAAGTAGPAAYRGEIEPELGFFEYFNRAITRKYASFSGRARRKEYWSFQLVYLLLLILASVSIGTMMTMGDADMGAIIFGVIVLIVLLAVIIPSIALSVRRLHDFGQPGWWILIVFLVSLVPYLSWISFIAYIVIGVIDSQPQENKYGPPVKKAA